MQAGVIDVIITRDHGDVVPQLREAAKERLRRSMRSGDIRFNGQAATVKHHSARGRITRNSGNFTRGSQLSPVSTR
ncbi:hypothetical protein ACM61V_21425 [Sphingomonas sp. TX0543]|uniref:hypothetical protein n=1 Tax=Sphingomonas sp. TX0543 TaxID=3399682 RepID=UPI003AFB6538